MRRLGFGAVLWGGEGKHLSCCILAMSKRAMILLSIWLKRSWALTWWSGRVFYIFSIFWLGPPPFSPARAGAVGFYSRNPRMGKSFIIFETWLLYPSHTPSCSLFHKERKKQKKKQKAGINEPGSFPMERRIYCWLCCMYYVYRFGQQQSYTIYLVPRIILPWSPNSEPPFDPIRLR